MKILIVEDEIKAGDYLKQGLGEAGFIVDLTRDGLDGMQMALAEAYDLIVLDVMLPTLDGWQVLSALRKAGQDTPVIFLTARDQVGDRVKGLELGADDYLVKPFSFAELLARVRTLLRRGKTTETSVLMVADLELDLLKRRVSRAGERIELTAKEFTLLELLMRNAAGTVKNVSLELGGNAPVIIFDDVDVDAIAKAASMARFRNNGQVCIAPQRFYVHKNIYQQFSEAVTKYVAQLKVGNGFEEGVNLGPLITKKQQDRKSVV